MAYERFGRKSPWYIFWEEPKGRKSDRREEAVLAVWHQDHRSTAPSFKYAEVVAMLESGDYSRIPGYREEHLAIIEPALREFIKDVNEES